MNAGEVFINVSEPILENKEIREMLNLNSDEVNNIDVTHLLNTEH